VAAWKGGVDDVSQDLSKGAWKEKCDAIHATALAVHCAALATDESGGTAAIRDPPPPLERILESFAGLRPYDGMARLRDIDISAGTAAGGVGSWLTKEGSNFVPLRALAASLAAMESVNMAGVQLTDEGGRVLAEVFADQHGTCRLKRMILTDTCMGPVGREAMGRALLARDPTRKRHLRLRHLFTDDWRLEANTTALDLSAQGLDTSSALLLAGLLRVNKGVTALDISHNRIGYGDVDKVAAVIQSLHGLPLVALDLAGNCLNQLAVGAATELLHGSNRLTALNLSSNRVAAVMPRLAQAMAANRSLLRLDLGDTGLIQPAGKAARDTGEGLEPDLGPFLSAMDGVRAAAQLEYLGLSRLVLGGYKQKTAVERLGRTVAAHPALQTLVLAHCMLSKEDMGALHQVSVLSCSERVSHGRSAPGEYTGVARAAPLLPLAIPSLLLPLEMPRGRAALHRTAAPTRCTAPRHCTKVAGKPAAHCSLLVASCCLWLLSAGLATLAMQGLWENRSLTRLELQGNKVGGWRW
jgi:hypothetical protein